MTRSLCFQIFIYISFYLRTFSIMSTKAIYEATGKKILNKYLGSTAAECRCVSIDADTNWDDLLANNRWLESEVFH